MKTFLTILLTALLAVAATWLTLRQLAPATVPGPAAAAQRHARFYQCAMHPWIKSDQPGRCTICGMELTPVYEGNRGGDTTGGGQIVALTQNQIQVLHVQTVAAQTRPLVRTLPVAGTLEENAARHRVLAAYVDGRIDKLYVNYQGAEVAEGEPLAEFYSPALLQAEREYRQLGGEMRHNTGLRLRQMGVTPAQIAALGQKPAERLTSQVLSPISGTVVSQVVYSGQYVATGAPLFEITDFSTMWFVFRAYEQDLPWLTTGQVVRIATPSLPGKSYAGKITFIDPNFDAATRSTRARVELQNPLVNGRRELLNRIYAEGLVELDAPAVLTVPRSAVIETGPEAVVYCDQGGGTYAHTVVQTGRRGDTLVEILAGLKEGDPVVTNGNLLIDGQAEMNRSFMAPAEAAAAPPTGLDAGQQAALTEFLKVADALASALAEDDLTAITAAGSAVMPATASMVKQLRSRVADGKSLDALEGAGHFHGVRDLPGARLAFHHFSVAATTVLEALRNAPGAPAFQLYECPMANQAIPDAPTKARWLQTGGRAMRNPFFGKEMPDCGVIIRPTK